MVGKFERVVALVIEASVIQLIAGCRQLNRAAAAVKNFIHDFAIGLGAGKTAIG